MTSAAEFMLARARKMAASPDGIVLSPCVSVCRIDPVSEVCAGCFRTLDEVAAWGRMPDEQKREVWKLIARRAAG